MTRRRKTSTMDSSLKQGRQRKAPSAPNPLVSPQIARRERSIERRPKSSCSSGVVHNKHNDAPQCRYGLILQHTGLIVTDTPNRLPA